MEEVIATLLGALFVIGLIVAIYCVFCKIIANCIQRPYTTKKAFWWIFFFQLFGAIIYILLSTRDNY